jgi:hypothetical protein
MERLSRADRDALRRAIRMVRKRDERYREFTDAVLAEADDGTLWSWGESAAYGLQCDALRLKPWQAPPVHAYDEIERDVYGHEPEEVGLLKCMLALGLSRFEPDPLAAIDAAEAKAVKAKANTSSG